MGVVSGVDVTHYKVEEVLAHILLGFGKDPKALDYIF